MIDNDNNNDDDDDDDDDDDEECFSLFRFPFTSLYFSRVPFLRRHALFGTATTHI